MKKRASAEKTPYVDRSELDKIRSQYRKLDGLHGREEWSAAVVRSATAAELAANLAIRREFSNRGGGSFSDSYIDGLLIWASGLNYKMTKLLLPFYEKGSDQRKELDGLNKDAKSIADKRNLIAHSGHFCSKREAKDLIEKCEKFVETLVRRYEPGFELRAKVESNKSARPSSEKPNSGK